MKKVGVTDIDLWFILDEDSILNDLLLFDKIFFHFLKKRSLLKVVQSIPGGENKLKEKLKEIEILEKNGLVEELEDTENHFIEHINAKTYSTFIELIKFKDDLKELKPVDPKDIFVKHLEMYRKGGQLFSRLYAISLNEKSDDYYVPIWRKSFDYYNINDLETKKASTLSVVLKKFPIPKSKIPLDKFIEFKTDPDTILKMKRLNDWVNDISKLNFSERELAEKIDYLIIEYKEQLDNYKIKYELGAMESIIMISTGILENILKLNFSNVAKLIFDLSKKRLQLFEEEKKMIGKEIAFINKFSETFT
jgi:hypothetical protein